MVQKQQILIAWNLGKSERSIAKQLGLNRKTVRKYIQDHKKRLSSEELNERSLPVKGIMEAPSYKSNSRSRRVLTDEMVNVIEDCLAKNAEKRANGNRKQCLKKCDILSVLQAQGHAIKYSTLTAYIRRKQPILQEAFIRQSPVAGSRVEFDWGEVKLVINGQQKRFQLAVFTSSYSSHRYAYLFNRQDMSSFLSAHVHYFNYVGGVSHQFIYDNMRTAVAKFACKNKDKQATEGLLKLSAYYGFSIGFCNARKGNEKGAVERSVEYIRRKAFAYEDCFENLEAANKHLLEILGKLNSKHTIGQQDSIAQNHQKELTQMYPCPIASYDIGQMKRVQANTYACIKLDNNFYSIPDHLVGHKLDLRTYPDYIIIYDFKNKEVARHVRQKGKHQYYLNLHHYLPTLIKKPGALVNSTCFKQADNKLKTLFELHFKDQIKCFLEILQWLKTKQLGIDDLKIAIDACLKLSPNEVPSQDKIIYFLDENNRKQNSTKLSDTNMNTTFKVKIQQNSNEIYSSSTVLLNQVQELITSTNNKTQSCTN